jgi:hypothetical protein
MGFVPAKNSINCRRPQCAVTGDGARAYSWTKAWWTRFKGSFYKESRASQTANSERHDGLVPVGLVSKASMRASTPCRQLPITGATKPRAVYIAVTCVRIWPRGRRDRQGFPNKPPSRTEVAEG